MIEAQFLGHSTVLLELAGTRVLTDPFLRDRLGPLQRHGAMPDARDLEVDVVLISHGHPDHFDPRSIEALPGDPVVLVPRGLGTAARLLLAGRRVIEIEAGRSADVDGLRLSAVPARHWITPRAPRANPIGYVLEGPRGGVGATGGAGRVYFAGDTGQFASMAGDVGSVDLALLPVWTWGPHLGPGHLGPRSAAEVTAALEPRAVIPIHWATLYPRQLHRVWRGPLADPGHRFAQHVRALSPSVAVHVLRPGERVALAAG